MCDVRYGYNLGCVIDGVYNPVITDSNAPLILVPSQLFAASGPRVLGERKNLSVYAGEQCFVQRIEFLLRRLFNVERVITHAYWCASSDWRDIVRRVWPFPFGAIPTQDRP
jgi:hypothetical protein